MLVGTVFVGADMGTGIIPEPLYCRDCVDASVDVILVVVVLEEDKQYTSTIPR